MGAAAIVPTPSALPANRGIGVGGTWRPAAGRETRLASPATGEDRRSAADGDSGDVTGDMRIAREGIFRPVVSLLKWRDEDDLIARVNALDYGLTASIWTRDLARAHRLAGRVEAGYVWVNDASTDYVGVPFGGYKQSGIGREEPIEELLACTQIKNVNVKLSA